MTTDNYPLFYQLRYAGQFPLVFKIKLISLCAVKMAHQEKVAHLSPTSMLQRVEGYCAEGIQPDWMDLHRVWFQPAFFLLLVVDRQEFWRPQPSFLLEQAALWFQKPPHSAGQGSPWVLTRLLLLLAD